MSSILGKPNGKHTKNYAKHVTKIHTDNLKEARIVALKRTAITRFGVFDWLASALSLLSKITILSWWPQLILEIFI